jgi:TonB family protein
MAHLNRILLLCCAILLVAMDALAQPRMAPPSSAWQKYRVEGEEFSIALPTVPAMATYKSSQDRFNQKVRTQHQLGVYADGVVYTIYSDDDDPQKGITNSLERLLPAQGWDPATEQIVSHDGVPGKQYTSSHPLGGVIQVFATKKHFYRIQAFGATAADPRVQHFFSSLTFGKNEGIEISDGPGTPLEPVDGSVQIPAADVFTGNPVDRKIIIFMKPEPSYTEEARQRRVVGTVLIRAVASANGSMVNIEVKQGLPAGLTEQAVEALKKMKFIPAAKDGKLVSTWIELEYNFNLY